MASKKRFLATGLDASEPSETVRDLFQILLLFWASKGCPVGLSGGYLAAPNLSQQNLVWVSFVGVNNQKGPNPHTFNYIYPVRIETPPHFMCMPMCFGNVGMEKLAYEIAPRAGCHFELVFWVVLEFTNIHILWNHIPSLKTFCKICKPPRIEGIGICEFPKAYLL